jgi:formate-dependent nitrite reductase cytochrome c552 subunit
VQCENCHGPNGSEAHNNAADLGAARISLASEVCGVCHGRPTNHGRYQAWVVSGHANVSEGASDHLRTASCGGCHSGQGALAWFEQLDGGNPTRTIDAATWTALGLTLENTQSVTCAVCHVPHNPGKAMLDNVLIEEDTTLTEAQKEAALQKLSVRIMDDTAMLPAGFQAIGVGNGALCITCHNSRNGEFTYGTPTVYTGQFGLHEDGDVLWGAAPAWKDADKTLGGYAAPHEAAQGDVLLGRNGYFVQGVRAGHADIGDSCVTCHMKLSKAPTNLTSATASNHTFKASAEICADCHGEAVPNAEHLATAIEAELQALKTAMEKAVTRLKGDGVAVTVTPGRSPKVTPEGGVEGNLADYLAFNETLAKANWNYTLIHADASKGAHNPKFAHDVLFRTTQKVNGL